VLSGPTDLPDPEHHAFRKDLADIALATIFLSALSAWLLFPARRPVAPRRDWAIGIVIAVLVATSFYQLIWLRTSVLG
jgi:hypothetical protein